MAEVKGLNQLTTQLRQRAEQSKKDDGGSVVVSFTAAYALYVHENLEAKHPKGQAKFLEGPARRLSPELAEMVKKDMATGMSMPMALLRAGLRLQREAQQLCPVDTGALKGSASTEVEKA